MGFGYGCEGKGKDRTCLCFCVFLIRLQGRSQKDHLLGTCCVPSTVIHTFMHYLNFSNTSLHLTDEDIDSPVT